METGLIYKLYCLLSGLVRSCMDDERNFTIMSQKRGLLPGDLQMAVGGEGAGASWPNSLRDLQTLPEGGPR